ncbi:ISL3 family transposase [Hyalangium gracile]|uniref:ISL3 family transposase n=1 Tax=Hyalangium gracile TaxID=394092 RepID=UPI00389918BC
MARVGVEEVLRRLLGVKALVVRGAQFEPHGVEVQVRPRQRRARCGECGRPSPGYDTSASRLWRHLSLGRTAFWLRYAPRRVLCREHGVKVERVPWAAHGSHFTYEFDELTAWLAQRMDKTATCRLMGINWRTVGTVVQRVVQARLDSSRLEELYIIGVDELSFRRHHEYVTVVVDHLKKRVVWVAEGKGEKTLQKFFDELGPERSQALTHVSMDLGAAYQAAVEARAPQAQKVFDRFHVQKLASEAVDTVRRQEVGLLGGAAEGRALKKSRWALLKNPWNLTQRQGQKLSEVARTNKRLYRAYLLKESLAKGLDYRQPGRAEQHLDGWAQWASHSKLKPFVKLSRTIRRFKQGILAYISTGLSNGLVEGLNNKIRLITRRAFGFHSAEALTAMIHLCCGGLSLTPPLPVPN